MNSMLLHKYRPTLEDFNGHEIIEHLLNFPPLRLLIMGNGGVGKTSLADLISVKSGAEVFRVSNLDQSLTFIRTEVKTFCTTVGARPKMLLIDNLDMISENGQHLLLKMLPTEMHFVATATMRHGVCESIHSTILPFYIAPLTQDTLFRILTRILEAEGRELSAPVCQRLIEYSNMSCRRMINLVNKVLLLPEVTIEAVDEACVHIACIPQLLATVVEKDVSAGIKTIVKVHNDGYTVLDILYAVTNCIQAVPVSDQIRYELVKVCCKYSAIYYERHEHPLELVFFILDLVTAVSTSSS